MKGNPEHKIEAIIDALIESDQMESTARYLTSGRRFAHLETEEIKKRWTQAARTFLISYGGVNPREMDDLSSELGLRKVALPCEDIRDETTAVARRIGRDDDPEGHARISDRIREFRHDLERPRN
jgi:copper homeostasis protein CutC